MKERKWLITSVVNKLKSLVIQKCRSVQFHTVFKCCAFYSTIVCDNMDDVLYLSIFLLCSILPLHHISEENTAHFTFYIKST